MMGFKNGRLWRRASESRVDRSLELRHRVAIILRDLRRSIAELSSTKVDVFRGIGDLLTSPFFLNETVDVLFDFATFQR